MVILTYEYVTHFQTNISETNTKQKQRPTTGGTDQLSL